MKLKNLIVTLFFLSNFFTDSKNEAADISLTQIKDIIFSEKNDTSLTEFGISVATVDVNGDFFDDLIISEIRAGRVVVYFGGEEIDTVPDLILHTEQEGSNYGGTVLSAGDINNDGFNDIMVGASHYCIGNIDYHGRVYIYYGGTQMNNIPDLIFQGRIKSAFLGTDIAKLGDINSDGCDDIGMCELNNDTCYIYFGGTDVDTIPDLLIYINDDTRSHTITGGGDFNNDSVWDILIGSPYFGEIEDWSNPMYPIYYPPYGRAYLFYGGETLDSIPDIMFEGKKRGDRLGYRLPSSNGDINNDSIGDLFIGAYDDVELFYGGDQPDNIYDVSLHCTSNGQNISYVGDINNDNVGDIVLISQEYLMSDGYAHIHFGGEDFDDIPDKQITFHGLSEYWGISVFNSGDINSDNQNDLILTYRNEANGEVQVFFGGDVYDSVPDLFYRGLKHDDSYGTSVSAGDINNDGYSDIIIGAPEYSSNIGRAYLYLGSKKTDTIVDYTFMGKNINTFYGAYVNIIGDINNDDYDDILISESSHYSVTTKSYLFKGGVTFDTVPDILFSHDLYESFNSCGDINNDGYDDIIASNDEQIGVFLGGSDMDSLSDFTINIQHNNFCSAGDINNDGYDDIIASYTSYNSGTGRAYIFWGGEQIDDTVDVILTGKETKSYFGSRISSLGDINNDGFEDIIVRAFGINQCYVFFGGNPMDTIPDITFGVNNDSIYQFGINLTNIKDINGDNINDIMVGAFAYDLGNPDGRAFIYFGGKNLDSIPDVVFILDNQTFSSISSAGDINGDSGYDIIFGSNGYNISSPGLVRLFYGNPLLTFDEQPLDVNSCIGDTVKFSVSATNALNYSWEMSTDSGTTFFKLEDNDYFKGSETSSLQVVARTDISERSFRCKLNNKERYRYSDTAYLSTHTRPTALFLGDSLYCMEDSVELAIELTGSSPWIYTLSNGLDSTEYIVSETNHLFFVDNPGTYKVISLKDKYCPGIKTGGDIDVYPHPTSLLTGSGSLCGNDVVTLTIDFSGSSPWYYTLSDGINSEDLVTNESYHTFNVDNPGVYSIISLQDKNCVGLNMSGEVEVEDCSSIISIEDEEIIIYPNPTDGKLNINNLPNRADIQINSTSGQTVFLSKVNNNKMIEIDLSFCQPGIYFLKIIMEVRIQINRIIIE